MNKFKINLAKIALMFGISLIAQMSYSGFEFGNKEKNQGQLNIGGAFRGKYVYDHYSDPTSSKFSFSDAILWLDYESPNLIGHLDYRIYEYYGHLGDTSWLTDAWLAYKINDKNKIIAGLNPVPFGPGRFWGNTFFLGIGNVIGLEDVHNLGVNYQFKTAKNQIDLAYYPTDSGNFQGHSKDAKRFSIGPVDADEYVKNGTNTKEKNMLVARYAHRFKYNELNYQLGTSIWYSDIENRNYNTIGSRKAWSIFTDLDYKNWNSKLLFGHQDINNKDPIHPDHITLGGFDYSFNSATEGIFYSAELSYLFSDKLKNITTIRPYLNFSGYTKKNDQYSDSMRFIPGVSFKLKDLTVQAEYLIGKNDPYLGNANGLTQGDSNKWNKKTYISLAYYF